MITGNSNHRIPIFTPTEGIIYMIIELISNVYEGRIKLQEPLAGDKIDLSEELRNILFKTNGIMETMSISQENEPIDDESELKAESFELFFSSINN